MNRLFDFTATLFYLCSFLSLAFVFCKHALQMFQQNHYELYRYSKWLFNKKNLKFSLTIVYSLIVIAVGLLFPNSELPVLFITIAFAIYFIYKESEKVYIKDLVLTARVKRQIIVLVLIFIAFLLCCRNLFPNYITGILTLIMSYLFIYPLSLLTMPIEYAIKKHYENDAKRILESNESLLKIGITGSYGKTSTKNILNDIISDNRFTLITPASYNTPMGITRTIREMLKPIHEVFICEMGADKVGDISYLMNFVKPKYGIVTSIGPQHLNTFHNIDNIINEKMQEIEMLPPDGTGFVNLDNEYIASYHYLSRHKVVSVGIDNKNADLVAENISYRKDGSSFSVNIDGTDHEFTTTLLGKHNISNILIGIAVALEMNIPIEDIKRNVKHISQIEHRLEVKKINGYTFIDDAFNSNPVGSKMAVDVLSLMSGKRVIVTPGMIDLGDKEDEINEEFGSYMADKVDKVILVGEKQTKAILKGLKDKGFNEEDIHICKNVREAFDYVYANFSRDDTILLENDLPDAFNV